MMEWFYTVISFIIGAVGGAAAIAWKYRGYIKIAMENLIDAYRDGKLEFREAVKMVIDAYSIYTKRDPRNVADEVIAYLKEKYGV